MSRSNRCGILLLISCIGIHLWPTNIYAAESGEKLTRIRMGLAGRRLFETSFASAKMAERSLRLYDLVAERHRSVA